MNRFKVPLVPGPEAASGPVFDRRNVADALLNAGLQVDLDRGAVHPAFEVAAAASIADDDRPIAAAVLLAALLSSRRGDFGFDLADQDAGSALGTLIDALHAEARTDKLLAAEIGALIAALGSLPVDRLGPILGTPEIPGTPLTRDGSIVYRRKDYLLEERLGHAFARLARNDVPVSTRDLEPDVAFAEAIAQSALVLVAGGPGTGKTTLIARRIRALEDAGSPRDSIALAAPTGKAAQRLAESLTAAGVSGYRPVTLHRLLEYSPSRGDFRRSPAHPIDAELIVVDEASMIDARLAAALAAAVRPGARLCLVGDADQLPAVGGGAVFSSLVRASEQSSRLVKLTKNRRIVAAGSRADDLLRLSHLIRDGETSVLSRMLDRRDISKTRAGDLAFEGVEFLDASTSAAIEAFVDRWFERFIARDERFAPIPVESLGSSMSSSTRKFIDDALAKSLTARLFLPRRTGPLGTRRINEYILARRARNEGADRRDDILPGTPILFSSNDYERDVTNGDVGLTVLASDARGRTSLWVVLPRGERISAFPLRAFEGSFEPAYAVTVHKSQGSEFDHGALFVTPGDTDLVYRQLVYTAATRVKKSLTFVGEKAILVAAAKKRPERRSSLGERFLSELSRSGKTL